jgi:S-adenosylmethionine:tRNA ribosyltransferase-isomerase
VSRSADYDYALPDAAIAQRPIEPRDAARLLDATADPPVDRTVADLPELLSAGDVLVLNDTRVLPARLRLQKRTGGHVEVLLLRPLEERKWEALVRPSRRVAPGTRLGDPPLVEVGERKDGNGDVRIVTLLGDPWAAGELPLPPYIHEPLSDPERYQTVYAAHPGSVAAPTAGLHLTTAVLDRCRAAGAQVVTVELSVGLDTFRPITVDDPADHPIHSESYRVPAASWDACRSASRVVAVGTTTVRALEAAARTGRLEGSTDLYIRAGFKFEVVDVLMTNFHLPRSTLLLLVEAFVGERWRELYGVALERGYRFLSFGDAMFVARA